MSRPQKEFNVELWEPSTSLGRAVKEGRITSISQILRAGNPIKEVEVVDALVPNLEERVLGVSLVQRMHKSGRRVKYKVVVVVGNRDGVVGVGQGSTREISSSIRKAVNNAKLNLIEVVRGCGSWECGCGRPHSVPFKVTGKRGSARVTIIPAPRGLGIAAAEVPRTILRMAGIKDAWTRSEGQTRTTLNFAFATIEALRQTTQATLREQFREHVHVGNTGETNE
ncbi:MAG: 30S ribosomal protein S5 [Hadesarchaea archaeon]|nr:MAG: 30S ribosomal protein S5 [Hadesarchaea archaeon]HDI12554.1 30S ribosomal protein S5 [Hadesarchaea archaeon]